jgi:hypothetical protein
MAGYSDYTVQWQDGKVGRLNPLSRLEKHQATMEPKKLSSLITLRRFSLKVPLKR